MRGALWTITIAALVAVSGCVASSTEDVGRTEAAVGGKVCYSSDDCNHLQYCTTEDGDCNSPCPPNEPCIAVCTGYCHVDDREQCGDVVCGAGMECCNASCGICVEPGGFCTQEVCDSTTTR